MSRSVRSPTPEFNTWLIYTSQNKVTINFIACRSVLSWTAVPVFANFSPSSVGLHIVTDFFAKFEMRDTIGLRVYFCQS